MRSNLSGINRPLTWGLAVLVVLAFAALACAAPATPLARSPVMVTVVSTRDPLTTGGGGTITATITSEAWMPTMAPPESTPPAGSATPPAPVGASPAPTAAPPPTSVGPRPTATAAPCLPNATYVQDVSIPDNSALPAGQAFTKVWRLRSTGCANWPAGTSLVRVSGANLGVDSVPVNIPARGATVDVSVSMRAPTAPGTYRSDWQMRATSGARFGDVIFVVFRVPAPAATAAPTAAPTVRPTVAPTQVPPTGGLPFVWFVADRYLIRRGECAVVQWRVDQVQAVFYDGYGVEGQGSIRECPRSTTEYELKVQMRSGRMVTYRLTIAVMRDD